ncbi:HNH endonuclease [Gordonia sp. ABSL1-1]|uniref:HNH endonuclease n=1 Tax=Gordonia sp. ABSL1-1 TaxID=3053923 RepID=UPI002572AB16|nr:HNH endonuclease [Gordonia sp. ABSL1-1]MDL9938546.1 HNH endonuclease [Gordonia sp. ABSL1-1]
MLRPDQEVPRPAEQLWGRRRVLLLNATYEPLTAVSIRRAVVLILRERADIVHEDDAGLAVHSVATSVPIPSVIRLRTYVRVPYRAITPMTRTALMHRDRFQCAYCGDRATTIDHVIPRSRGGAHGWDNCVACCSGCNHRKADRLLSELGWSLASAPREPKGRHWRLLATVTDIDPAWVRYIDAGAA